MKVKTQVVFDMSFNNDTGECKSTVSFSLPEHPDVPVSDELKTLLMREIALLSGAARAAEKMLFGEPKRIASK